jgi:hypothetical protein
MRSLRAAAAAAALDVTAGLTPAVAATPVPAVDSDQPCMRRPPVGAVLQDVGFRPDDLAKMVLPKASLGAAAGSYVVDWMRYGYLDNTEFAQVELAPSGSCDITKAYGRILGFSGSYSAASGPYRYVTSSVHLFFSPADASAWLRAFVARLRAQVGSQGIRSVGVTSLPALGAGAVRLQVTSADGIRSWVLFPRGTVVGSVLHARPSGVPSGFDVTSLASVLRQRIDTVTGRVAARTEKVDAPLLLSLPLPKAVLGTRYASFTWDWFVGGCLDVTELETRQPAVVNVAYDARRFGLLVACAGLFSAPTGTTGSGTRRVQTQVTQYATATGAHGALLERLADAQRLSGKTYEGTSYGAVTRFTTPPLGDEVLGIQRRFRCACDSVTHTSTEIVWRRGPLVLRAWIDTVGLTSLGTEIRRIATAFDQRAAILLARNAT